jgi:streptogramin lyase
MANPATKVFSVRCSCIILVWSALCAVAACSPLSTSYSVAPQTTRNADLHTSDAHAKAKFKEYTVPSAQSEPYKMVLGPDGNYWFTEFAGNKVANVTPAGKFAEFDVPSAQSEPSGITVGPDHNLWFTEAHTDKIGKLTISGKFTEYTVPTAGADPSVIRSGGGNLLWFTERGGDKIGEITTSGKITEFIVPTPDSEPSGICIGPDNAIWFTEDTGDKVGRMTISGKFTEYDVPPRVLNPEESLPARTAHYGLSNLTGTTSDALRRLAQLGIVAEQRVRHGDGSVKKA